MNLQCHLFADGQLSQQVSDLACSASAGLTSKLVGYQHNIGHISSSEIIYSFIFPKKLNTQIDFSTAE
jgi:hypothetical protein